MTKQEELNKKIAEWAGFHFYPECECIRCKGICWGESEKTYGEDGQWHFVLPQFTRSLDACFQYIVPKLKFLQLRGKYISGNWEVAIVVREGRYEPETVGGSADTPALAFCKAVEKLIDGEQG